jgi:hypothetical protein
MRVPFNYNINIGMQGLFNMPMLEQNFFAVKIKFYEIFLFREKPFVIAVAVNIVLGDVQIYEFFFTGLLPRVVARNRSSGQGCIMCAGGSHRLTSLDIFSQMILDF